MNSKTWILLAAAIATAGTPLACASDFRSCYERRNCPKGGAGGGSEAGAAGESDIVGGTGGAPEIPEAGAAGDAVGDGGTSGDAGAAGSACDDTALASDPHNCGMCGHDCLGGECEAAQCQPVTVVPAESYISHFVVVGGYLYWSWCDNSFTEWYVARSRLDGSDTVKQLTKEQALRFTASANQLIWGGEDQVRACDLPNCPGGARNLVEVPKLAFANVHFAAASQTLLWSGKQSGLTAFKLGSPAATPILGTRANAVSIASDERYVYWDNQPSALGANDGAIYKARLSDLSPVTLASATKDEFSRLAVAPNAVYASGNHYDSDGHRTSTIFKIPLPNGSGTSEPPRFLETQADGGMTVFGSYLYWGNNDLGSIQRCPLAGCDAPEIVVTTSRPGSLTQDATSFYWTTFSSVSGLLAIVRLAK